MRPRAPKGRRCEETVVPWLTRQSVKRWEPVRDGPFRLYSKPVKVMRKQTPGSRKPAGRRLGPAGGHRGREWAGPSIPYRACLGGSKPQR